MPELRAPTAFRLRPYDADDNAAYDRPDGAHHEALRWLKKTNEPFLYLTGFSGTGKSSLLQAWLVPELKRAEPPTVALVTRSFADPIRQLTEALIHEDVLREGDDPADLDPGRSSSGLPQWCDPPAS